MKKANAKLRYCDFFPEPKVALKLMFYKKAIKIDKIFTVNLTLCSMGQIDSEDFVNICGLLRKHELKEQYNH